MTSLLETVPVFLEDLLQHPVLRNLPIPMSVWDDLAIQGVNIFKHRQKLKAAPINRPDRNSPDWDQPMQKEAAVNQLAQDVHAAAVESGLAFPREEWTKAAFVKLARLGALVFLPTKDGKFLLQKNGPAGFNPGKLRPPGGHHEASDETLQHTVVREMQEEFDLKPEEIEGKLKYLGREYRVGMWGNALFELKDHGLSAGTYQASNHPDEKVELVEASLDDDDYVGPLPWRLLSAQAHLKGLEAGMGDKVNKS